MLSVEFQSYRSLVNQDVRELIGAMNRIMVRTCVKVAKNFKKNDYSLWPHGMAMQDEQAQVAN